MARTTAPTLTEAQRNSIKAALESAKACLVELAVDVHRWEVATQGKGVVAEVALSLWGLIHITREEELLTFDEAAKEAHRLVIAYHKLSGIGDLRYLGAIRLIEQHMKDGAELRLWHTTNYGV